MTSALLNVFLGILSGVFTATILLVAGKYYRRLFIPWYENRLYKGVVLDGKWEGTRTRFSGSENTKEKKILDKLEILLELTQSGYKICGLFRAKSTFSQGEIYENLYNITGRISDNYVVLEYIPLSRKRTGLGTFVLHVKNGGRRMEGSISFVEEGEMEVTSLEGAILNRKDD